MEIPYNRPPICGKELDYISDVVSRRHLSGDGLYTKKCNELIQGITGGAARITHSCTAALEMAAILVGLEPGDEVIMPSFTFVSTANAVVLRGAVPVFVDIVPDTLTIDPAEIEDAITSKTRAIIVVHYAGVCAEMDTIQVIADRHNLIVIEDAAQALYSRYRGRPAGSLSALACFSFHETKNIVCGEGGALVVNNPGLIERADIIREKGTNRTAFHKKIVDKYTWLDIGSSYLPGELVAAFLCAQLEVGDQLIAERRAIWSRYHYAFESCESLTGVRRPVVPAYCEHNGHIYYLLMRSLSERDFVISQLAGAGILAPFHYIPLHSSPAGLKFGRSHGALPFTSFTSDRLIRLPLYVGMGIDQEKVISKVLSAIA